MKIIVFGEILWDIFGEKKEIGGAAYNFAAHSAKLGCSVQLISAVGDDELGREAIKTALSTGIDVSGISICHHPTGYCLVTLKDGTPTYNLVQNVAYDYIPLPPDASFFNADAFYFGTLSQRNDFSAATLKCLLEKGKYNHIFFDINIRQNFYSDEMIDEALKHTTIFKVSREEIHVLGLGNSFDDVCVALSEKYPSLQLIIVTLDAEGSIVYDVINNKFIRSVVPRADVVSTVGAGDSYSACFVSNLLAGNSLEVCIANATALSSYLVTQLGAVPEYPEGKNFIS